MYFPMTSFEVTCTLYASCTKPFLETKSANVERGFYESRVTGDKSKMSSARASQIMNTKSKTNFEWTIEAQGYKSIYLSISLSIFFQSLICIPVEVVMEDGTEPPAGFQVGIATDPE